ncbi:hypothetical protein DYU11_14615 [Fibrisoma montanum]|uniref:Outer membrane protein beta-barrel domain-containing protein n=1 Tax=Fibrisoma montanum TaxID=2305895 RepID=A0A418M805_9BACT|nr:hypothetical protein [Fibrisoma montanum]RIV22258.1 hypothetical protein DYU11_14615 [Fibrisoma montanum]
MKIYWIATFSGALWLGSLSTTFAQRSAIWQEKPGTWVLNAGVGVTRYAGDLNEGDFLAKPRLGAALNVAFAYRMSNRLVLRAETQLYTLRGSQQNTRLAYNNLSFKSLNPDVWAGLQVDAWPVNHRTRKAIPYGFAGIGFTYITPKATYKGETYSLAPLQTEGVTYNRLPVIIRYGAGLPIAVTDRFKIHLEGSYTHVMSDYVDDVSTSYAVQDGRSPLAVALSDRRSEIGLPLNKAGAQRGNSSKNDGYFILSVRFIHLISTKAQRNYRLSMRG